MRILFDQCFLIYNLETKRFELYDKRDNEEKAGYYNKLITTFPIDSIEVFWTQYLYEFQENSDYDLLINSDGKLKDYRD